jgi:hypothetical protein
VGCYTQLDGHWAAKPSEDISPRFVQGQINPWEYCTPRRKFLMYMKGLNEIYFRAISADECAEQISSTQVNQHHLEK